MSCTFEKTNQMKFPHPLTVNETAELINARIAGSTSGLVYGINEIHKVEPGDLCFVDHPRYYDKCLQSDASFIIIDQEVENRYGKTLLICDQPFEAYVTIVNKYRPFYPQDQWKGEHVSIGENTWIAPGVFIGQHVKIGKGCRIHANVSLYDYTEIGDDVVIHSGAVIGGDAFYYNSKKNREQWYRQMPSGGKVVIEDGVHIGANTCIDKGVSHITRIGKGTKIDNLVQIGHDVVIGANCIIAAQVGIAGATTVGNGVNIWGQAGINKTILIPDGVTIMGQAGVTHSLEAGKTYMGFPAEEAGIKRREYVWTKRIPQLWEKVMGK